MNTFLPYTCYAESARVLDRARLGKQRIEVLQILNVLVGPNEKAGWRNHPAVRMWRGFEVELAAYGMAACDEWARRGYADTVRAKITSVWKTLLECGAKPVVPPWIGRPEFHAAHRSNLLRKDPVWYGRFGWDEGPDLPYVWPV